jgi:hypothetical protein
VLRVIDLGATFELHLHVGLVERACGETFCAAVGDLRFLIIFLNYSFESQDEIPQFEKGALGDLIGARLVAL